VTARGGRARARVAAALALALGACGEDTPLPKGDLRVVLRTAAADGAPPADGFSLLTKDGARAHLVRKPGAGGEYVAQGADGLYRLDAPADWGVLGEAEHAYRRGLEPITVTVGRRRTLYVAVEPGWRVVDALVLPERTASDPESDLPGRREKGADGMLAVRLDEESWAKGPVYVTALLEDASSGTGGRFSTSVRGTLPLRGEPAAILVEPASVQPLAVRMTAAPAGGPAAGARAEATVWFGRLVAKQTASAGSDGVARLDRLPAPQRGVVTRVSVEGASYDVTSARDGEEALLAVAGPGALEAQGAYELSDGRGPAEVLGFVPGAGFGRIPWTEVPQEGGVRLRFRSPGVARWFVRRGDRGAFDGEGAPGARPPDGPLKLEALCRVQVSLPGVSSREPLDLVASRREGDAWVSGDGWTLRRRLRDPLEMLLPAGDWRLQAFAADGRAGPPTALKLAAPGAEASVRVQKP
jgi:hypothetical protein